jgi:hypothetical protein
VSFNPRQPLARRWLFLTSITRTDGPFRALNPGFVNFLVVDARIVSFCLVHGGSRRERPDGWRKGT